jgi:hypothetical protein
MKKQIKVEIEVIDDEHCSKKCYYFTHLLGDVKAPPYCTIAKSKYWKKIKKDSKGFLRTTKCKQAEK